MDFAVLLRRGYRLRGAVMPQSVVKIRGLLQMLRLIDRFFLFVILIMIAISFGCGYAVRDWISRRRHAADREQFYQRHPELRPEK